MTTTEITPELRQAVYEADCETLGHMIDVGPGIAPSEHRNGRRIVGPEGKMPHLVCMRCANVWIIIAKSGRSYNQAERRFRERLLPTDPEALPIEVTP
jgi:hypothetical protein